MSFGCHPAGHYIWPIEASHSSITEFQGHRFRSAPLFRVVHTSGSGCWLKWLLIEVFRTIIPFVLLRVWIKNSPGHHNATCRKLFQWLLFLILSSLSHWSCWCKTQNEILPALNRLHIEIDFRVSWSTYCCDYFVDFRWLNANIFFVWNSLLEPDRVNIDSVELYVVQRIILHQRRVHLITQTDLSTVRCSSGQFPLTLSDTTTGWNTVLCVPCTTGDSIVLSVIGYGMFLITNTGTLHVYPGLPFSVLPIHLNRISA